MNVFRNLLRHNLTLLFLGAAWITASAQSPVAHLTAESQQRYRLTYKAPQATDVRIQVRDSRNATLHTEVVRDREGFNQVFDFRNLPAGAYQLIVSARDLAYTEALSVVIEEAPQLELSLSQTTAGSNKYLLRVANAQDEQVLVRVLDQYSQVLFEEKLDIDANGKVFDLMQVPDREVTFLVLDGIAVAEARVRLK
ncbi:MAG: hypothetical protein OHK0039_33860 [Bacteroidia bacterium]